MLSSYSLLASDALAVADNAPVLLQGAVGMGVPLLKLLNSTGSSIGWNAAVAQLLRGGGVNTGGGTASLADVDPNVLALDPAAWSATVSLIESTLVGNDDIWWPCACMAQVQCIRVCATNCMYTVVR